MRAWTAVAVLAVLTGCSTSTSPSDSGQPSGSPGDPSASVAPSGPPTTPLEERTEARFQIPGADFPLVAFDSVWITAGDPPDPATYRIDPATNEELAHIVLSGVDCTGTAAGFDAIWACATDGVARIDPGTNTVTTVIAVDAVGQARLATGGGSVWAFVRSGDGAEANGVLRIDPTTNTVVQTIDLGHPLGTMAFGFDALWVTSPADGVLLRIDPATTEVATAAEGLDGPFTVVVGPDSLWVSLQGILDDAPSAGEPTIARLDPTNGETTASIVTSPIGRSGGIAAVEASVWVRSSSDFLTEIDPATNEVVEIITASFGGGDVAVGFGSVWTAAFDFAQAWRVSP